MSIPEHASCEECGREDRPLVTGREDGTWLCDRHACQNADPTPEWDREPEPVEPATLTEFVEAYEAYDGDCVGTFIHEWAQRLGVSA